MSEKISCLKEIQSILKEALDNPNKRLEQLFELDSEYKIKILYIMITHQIDVIEDLGLDI
ncbi:MAG TPA: hypothetical protein VLE02_01170 [Nitrosarchaeum sp.]|nr:hypothetical protein [Nitrosarchaeum sp.]